MQQWATWMQAADHLREAEKYLKSEPDSFAARSILIRAECDVLDEAEACKEQA